VRYSLIKTGIQPLLSNPGYSARQAEILKIALMQSRTDIAAGRFFKESPESHLKRLLADNA